jgi:hypothetical protein
MCMYDALQINHGVWILNILTMISQSLLPNNKITTKSKGLHRWASFSVTVVVPLLERCSKNFLGRSLVILRIKILKLIQMSILHPTSSRNLFTISPFLPMILPTSCKKTNKWIKTKTYLMHNKSRRCTHFSSEYNVYHQ